jgi:hypothetical protein
MTINTIFPIPNTLHNYFVDIPLRSNYRVYGISIERMQGRDALVLQLETESRYACMPSQSHRETGIDTYLLEHIAGVTLLSFQNPDNTETLCIRIVVSPHKNRKGQCVLCGAIFECDTTMYHRVVKLISNYRKNSNHRS